MEIRLKKGKKADCEARNQFVKGHIKDFDVISGQKLTSPFDPMHQLFLGVGKDHFAFYNVRIEHKPKVHEFNRKRQSFENIILTALFVGPSVSVFDFFL